MITEKQFACIREELMHSRRPLFIFDDDPDGLASFLLLYRLVREGKGFPLKSDPILKERYAAKVEEYGADKVFVLDIPMIEQGFADAVKVPIIWIDHHGPHPVSGVQYFNPRLANKDDNLPTSWNCYQVARQDLWIAMTGIVGDWYLDYAAEFHQQYPRLLPADVQRPQDALFASELGTLVKVFSFILKGKTGEVMKAIKVLTRIQDPLEILDGTTPQGRFILKKYQEINKEYSLLIKQALKEGKKKGKLLQFIYQADSNSFTKELSNELLYHFPEKTILVCREKEGKMKCSLRESELALPAIVQKALAGLEGYGGGHEHACGTVVAAADFPKFVERVKEGVGDR